MDSRLHYQTAVWIERSINHPLHPTDRAPVISES